MAEKLDLLEQGKEASAVMPGDRGAPPPVTDVARAPAAAPRGRKARPAGEDEADAEGAAAETGIVEEEVPADAPAAQDAPEVRPAAAATQAQEAGDKDDRVPGLTGFLSAAGLSGVNPVMVAGALAGLAGLALAASGGSSRPANRSPSAGTATASATEDGAAATGSLASGAADPDGDALTFSLSAPVAGLAVNADGSWSFDPSNAAYQGLAAGQSRVVTANYTVSDGKGGTAASTLTITVTGTNDGPVAAAEAVGVLEDAAVVTGSVASNDTDADGDALTYAAIDSAPGLTLNADGSYRFDAGDAAYQRLPAGETRVLVVRYTATDPSGAVATGALTVTVTGRNDAPVAAVDVAAATEDGVVVQGDVSGNDTDVDGDALTFSLVQPVAGLTLNADGSWSFDPSHPDYQGLAAGETRTIVAVYVADDGRGGRSDATLAITVTGRDENFAPIAADDALAAVEDSGVLTGTVATNDSDPDGDALQYTLVAGAPGLTMDSQGGYAFDVAHPDHQALAEGEVRVIVATYQGSDGRGGSATASLTITLTGRNDGPVARIDSAAAVEDGPLVSGSLAANDSDADAGAALTFIQQGAPVAGFTLRVDGSWDFDSAHADYQSLALGQTLTLVIPYSVADEHGATSASTLTLTVAGANDAPAAEPNGFAVVEGGASITGSVAWDEGDIDQGAVLTYSTPGAPGLTFNSDGSFTFDPADPAYRHVPAGETFDVVVPFTVTDEHGATSTSSFTVTIDGRNSRPEIDRDVVETREDAGVIRGSLAANDHDPDDDAVLTYSLVSGAVAGLTIDASGAWAFDSHHPAYSALREGETNVIVAQIRVEDDHGAVAFTHFVITVRGGNDAPIATADVAAATEDGGLVTGSVATNDADPDSGQPLAFALAAPVAGLTLDAEGDFVFDSDHPAYQGLAAGETRVVEARYTVTDDQGAVAESVLRITLQGVNDGPVGTGESYFVDADGMLIVSQSLLANDVDADGDALTARLETGPAHGTLVLNPDGTFSYTPNAGYEGPDSFTYVASDGRADSQPVTVSLSVAAPDNPTVHFAATGTEFGRIGGEQRVSVVAAGDENRPHIAGLAGGGFVVVWEDSAGDSSGMALMGRRYNAAGQALGPDFLVNTSTNGNQVQAKVTGLPGGGFVVTWTDDQGGADGEIRGQMYDAAGARVGSEFTIPTTTGDFQIEPTVTALASGGFVVAWTDASAGDNDIRAQIFGASGAKTGGEFAVNMPIGSSQSNASVGAMADGGFVIAWTDTTGDFSGGNLSTGVTAQRFAADGSRMGGEFLVNTHTIATQTYPSVTGLENGGFVVTWTDFNFPTTRVAYQVYDASGAKVGGERLVETVAPSSQALSVVTALSDGGFLISWMDGGPTGDGDAGGVKAQRFGASGEALGEPFIVNSVTAGGQGYPVVAALEGGGFAISWVDFSRVDDPDLGVKLQVFGDIPPFQATEQVALNLKDKVSVAEVDGGSGTTITAVLTVSHGVLEIVAGASGATVSGSGTASVTLTGTRAQINALLTADATSVARYTPTGDAPPANALLSVELFEGDTKVGGGNRVISIASVNDAPVLGAETLSVSEDAGLVHGDLSSNDRDPENRALTYTLLVDDDHDEVDGFTLNADGTWTFDADYWQHLSEGETETATATYIVTDGQGAQTTSSLTIQITGANDAPAAVSFGLEATEGQAGNLSGFIGGSFADRDSADDLNFSLDQAVPGLSLSSEGIYSFNPRDQGLDYLGDGETATLVARYTVVDSQGASDQGEIAITVHGANDGPTVDFNQRTFSFQAQEQAPLDLRGAIDVSDEDTNDVLTVRLSVTYGLLTVDPGGTGVAVTGDGSDEVALTGTRAQLRALLSPGDDEDPTGSISYLADTDTPPADATLTVVVDDGTVTASNSQVITIVDLPGFAAEGDGGTSGFGRSAERIELFDPAEDLIPVGRFDALVEDRHGVVGTMDEPAWDVPETGEDPLATCLAAFDPVETGGAGGTAPDPFAIPDPVVVLEPLDLAFLTASQPVLA